MKRSAALPILLVLALGPAACGGGGNGGKARAGEGGTVLRVGHFPNVTHAQGLVAHQLSRQGRGWFESRLGPGVTLEWYVYNAGPTAMEGLLNGSLDLAYVGPNPALNAHIRSGGEDIRVVAGAARGGAALVVRGDAGIKTPGDFRGRRIATPQFGNTQDVACRAWLEAHGIRVTRTGGDAFVIPTANPDQILLFRKGEIDAAWTVEPWVSRLVLEAGGKVFLEQPEALTTVLAAGVRTVSGRPELLRKFVAAHRELTAWINDHPDSARALVRAEIAAETRAEMPPELVAGAWPRLTFTDEVTLDAFRDFTAAARAAGFMPGAVDLSRLVLSP